MDTKNDVGIEIYMGKKGGGMDNEGIDVTFFIFLSEGYGSVQK